MMAIIRKLLKDWQQAKGQLILFLLSATLSAWGVSSVVYAYLMTERDFKQNVQASQPADLILNVADINPEVWSVLRSHPMVRETERREILSARILDKHGDWMPMMIFAVEAMDQLRVDQFQLKTTDLKQAPGILIEQKGAGFLDTGAALELQFSNGERQTWPISGWVHDARLPPSTMEHIIYGYLEIGRLDPHLLKSEQRILVKTKWPDPKVPDLQELGSTLKRLISGAGGQVTAIHIPPPGEHPHQNIVNGVAFLQQSFGWVLVFIGFILLSLTFLIWIYAQIRQIGILKAIGARSRKLYFSYLSVLALLVSVGLLAGLPLGYQTATFFSRFVAMIQNFEPVLTSFPWTVHLGVILGTTLAAVLVSFRFLHQAIQGGTRQNIQQVFFTRFIGWLDRLQDWIKDSRFKYPINNLFRQFGLNLLIVLLVASGMGLYLLGSNLRFSIRKDLQGFFAACDYAIRIQSETGGEDITFVQEVPGVKAVALIRHEPVTFVLPGKAVEASANLKIFPKAYAFSDQLLIKGALDRACLNCMYINQGYLPEFEAVSIGTMLQTTSAAGVVHDWQFAGVLKDVGALPTFYQFGQETNSDFDELAVQLSPDVPLAKVVDDLELAFADHHIPVKGLYRVDRTIEILQDHLDLSFVSIQVLGGITLLLGLLGVLLLIALILRERTSEIGILKAIGTASKTIQLLVGREISIITFIGSLLGLCLAAAFTPLFSELYGKMLLHTGFKPAPDLAMMAGSFLLFWWLQMGLCRWYIGRSLKKRTSRLMANISDYADA